jgi:hypothetical protein
VALHLILVSRHNSVSAKSTALLRLWDHDPQLSIVADRISGEIGEMKFGAVKMAEPTTSNRLPRDGHSTELSRWIPKAIGSSPTP